MNPILAMYDREVRANPVERPGLTVVQGPHLTRYEGAFNYVCCWKFAESVTADVVREQARYFRQMDTGLMWRVYAHDSPSNLEACLEREGFTPSPSGTLVALSLDASDPPPTAHDIRPVITSQELDLYLSVASEAFGDVDSGQFEYLSAALGDPDFALFSGYVSGRAVASARLEMAAGSSFGLMFGGGVLEAYRGRGLYRALVSARASVARKRGLKYLSTEAGESSRPILERLGFVPLTRETTWLFTP